MTMYYQDNNNNNLLNLSRCIHKGLSIVVRIQTGGKIQVKQGVTYISIHETFIILIEKVNIATLSSTGIVIRIILGNLTGY